MKCIICRKELNFFNRTSWHLNTTTEKYGACSSCIRKIPTKIWNNKKDKRSFYEALKELSILTEEQWNTIYLDEIAAIGINTRFVSGYIPYDIDNYVVIDEKSSLIMINQRVYQFSDIIGYEEGDNVTTYDVQGPEQEITRSKRHGLGRAVVGGMVIGPVGVAVGGLTGRKKTVTERSGRVSYSTAIHEYVLRVQINNLSRPVETLYFHNDENELREVIILLDRILSMTKL